MLNACNNNNNTPEWVQHNIELCIAQKLTTAAQMDNKLFNMNINIGRVTPNYLQAS